MERRFSTAGEIRAATVTDNDQTTGSTITGYAAVFHRTDDPGTAYQLDSDLVEHILPGAFDAALSRGDDVRALFNHDPDNILGRTGAGTLRLDVDEVGLRYEIDLPDTQKARDIYTSIARGDVSGSSFAFTIPAGGQSFRDDGDMVIREINSVELFDVGPVVFPAYQSASSQARDALHEYRAGAVIERATYKGVEIDTRPTAEMAEEAQKGLDWRAEYGRGGTEVGVARARDLINRRNLSIDTVKRMASYFARHEVDKQGEGWSEGEEGYPSAGKIAWLLWGGDPGRRFAERILDRVADIDDQDERNDQPADEAPPEPAAEAVAGIPADVVIATARLREIDAAE